MPSPKTEWNTAATLMVACVFALGCAHAAPQPGADRLPEPLLDNARVQVAKLVVAPGQLLEQPAHAEDELLVFIRGGVLRSAATGRSTLWPEGRVAWRAATRQAGDPGVNAGNAPIEVIRVRLKPRAAHVRRAAARSAAESLYLHYPNIPGEDLLENERVIVQRFNVNPGEWEGVHAHHPDMLYIHVKGGQWAARSYTEPEHAYPDASPDGEVGWMATIDIGAGHESGNIGPTPIDLIWVSFKEPR